MSQSKPKRLCAYPGCYRRCTGFFCHSCKTKLDSRKALRVEKFKKEQTNNPPTTSSRPNFRERNYPPAWDALSLAYRAKHPECEHCLLQGRNSLAAMVDHVYPVSFGFGVFRKKGYQSLCLKCHSRKTKLEMQFAKRHGLQLPKNEPIEGEMLEAFRRDVLLPHQ